MIVEAAHTSGEVGFILQAVAYLIVTLVFAA